MRRVLSASLFACVLSIGLWSCGGTTAPAAPSPAATITAATPTVTTVVVSGSPAAIGSTAQFAATASLSNGTTQSVTGQATWQSSALGVAAVSNAGIVTSVAAGEADITATYQNVSGRMHVTLTRAVAATFAVTGIVTDAFNGGLLNAATVTGAGQSTTTDANGRYSIAGVSAGSITVTAARTGFVTGSRSSTLSGDAQVNVALERVASAAPTPSPSPAPTPSPTPTPTPAPSPGGIPTCAAPPAAPAGSTAVCNDGTFSQSQNRSGTCSSHSGVQCWICPGNLCAGIVIASQPLMTPMPRLRN
jgi:hypothetical protein